MVKTDSLSRKERERSENTIAFWNRKLSEMEVRYPAYDRELAMRDAVEYSRYYLHGQRFTVQTDHQALRRLLQQKQISIRQVTYLDKLHSYDFAIKHWPGAKNAVADALSRRSLAYREAED